jgi:hypothetical protein
MKSFSVIHCEAVVLRVPGQNFYPAGNLPLPDIKKVRGPQQNFSELLVRP